MKVGRQWFSKGGVTLAQVTQIELQSIRHMLGEETLAATKAQAYARQCQDMELRSILESCAQKHQQRAQQLLQTIQG